MNTHKLAAMGAATLWGFTYIVSATMLPHHPWFIGAVRALLGSMPLVMIARELPPWRFWPKLVVLGTLNTGLFFGLLFISALRLPGGVAGTFQALGPLFSIVLVWPLLGHRPTVAGVASLAVGAIGVALVLLKGNATMDSIGVVAALGSAFSVALGGVLVQRWGVPMSLVGFTAWQLLIAGAELTVATVAFGDIPTSLTTVNDLGLLIVALGLTALPFLLWFKAIKGEGAANAAPFLLLVPLVAFGLDAVIRGIVPSRLQAFGVVVVIGGLVLNMFAARLTARLARLREGAGCPEHAVVD